uniref:Uncharacterized protein n=1 Tax=Magallana gigas TaxID=29159 RepID=A0A8W8JYR5_MAGGI
MLVTAGPALIRRRIYVRNRNFKDSQKPAERWMIQRNLKGLSVSSSDSGKRADLGDIVVDTDQHALDDFLQEEDTTPSVEAVATDKTEDTLSDYEEDPLVVRSLEDVEVEDEYYEDDIGASHGDQEPYSDS